MGLVVSVRRKGGEIRLGQLEDEHTECEGSLTRLQGDWRRTPRWLPEARGLGTEPDKQQVQRQCQFGCGTFTWEGEQAAREQEVGSGDCGSGVRLQSTECQS